MSRPEPEPSLAGTCKHCGAHGRMRHKEDVTVKQEVEGDWQQGGIRYDTIVGVYVCQACEEPTVLSYVWSDDTCELVNEQRLYPTQRDNSSLPPKVRQRLDAAMKVKAIDPSFYAVGIGRMLETVCNEEQASGKDLFEKLNDLAAQDRIPAKLARVAQQLRKLRNLGAHDDEIDVAPEDVPLIEDLADAILEYLYRAPAKLTAVQLGLDQRKEAAQRS